METKKGEHVSVRVGKKDYTAHISVRDHEYLADEPVSAGGHNMGPNPYELLLSALGSCTAVTLRMYSNRKDWPLDEINVHLSHSQDYAEDCKNCDEKEKKIARIDRKIELKGDLSDDQRKRLMQIANRCPVHKTLLGDIKIVSEEVN